MLARLLSWWKGKLFVLILLGFVATDFIITITLSAADATAHIVENPFMHGLLQGMSPTAVNIGITLLLIGFLSAVFLKGFKEAIGIAVVLVRLTSCSTWSSLASASSTCCKIRRLFRTGRTRCYRHPNVGGTG